MGSARDRVSDPRHARSVTCPSWPPLGQSRPISRFTPASPPRFPVSPTRATRALAPRLPVPSDVHSQALITVDVEPPGRPEDKRGIRSLDRKELFFMRDSITEKPFLIRVPLVTRKERHYLDQNMPCCKNWSPSAFEIRLNDIEDYSTIYRYYPEFTEMLL